MFNGVGAVNSYMESLILPATCFSIFLLLLLLLLLLLPPPFIRGTAAAAAAVGKAVVDTVGGLGIVGSDIVGKDAAFISLAAFNSFMFCSKLLFVF